MSTRFTQAEVHSFPSEDEEFRASVARAIELYEPLGPDALAGFLRRKGYPDVKVVAREPLAEVDPSGPPVWYVFRHGERVPDNTEV